MIAQAFYFGYYALILLSGICLSFAFAGVTFHRKLLYKVFILFLLLGLVQLLLLFRLDEYILWELYPVLVHIPLLFILVIFFRKRILTSIAAVCSAYLCCQPAKWLGLLTASITDNMILGQAVRFVTMGVATWIAFVYLSGYISQLYLRDTRSIMVFGIVPVIYYLFDYTVGIYTDLWRDYNQTVIEFLPCLLSIVHLVFCMVYYKQYEQKTDAERKEQIISIALEEQVKEIQSLHQSADEIRILRHDMRLMLSNVLMSIENDDKETAKKLISAYVNEVEATAVQRYCENTTLNYILSAFAGRCEAMHVTFSYRVEIAEIACDEIMLSYIISNALDNALNAQKELPVSKRSVKLLLRDWNGKLLLSVKNPYKHEPVFNNGLPISNKPGHGYGAQSIRFLTERMNGNCQFMLEDDQFVLRVIV